MHGRTKRQVVALGGGGLSGRGRRRNMDRYLLGLTGKRNPRVCFVPTATGDAVATVERFYRIYRALRCRPSHLPLFHNTIADLKGFILEHDLIYVGGGNTRNMLTLWKLWGVDVAIRKAYERGTVIAGPSAGGMAWFAAGLTDSYPKLYMPMRCLGWVEGSFCPHYDSEPKRRPQFAAMVASGALPSGYAVEDFVGLHFVDERLHRVVSTRRTARAYRVVREGRSATTSAIEPELL